jgi:hypothetical protein
VHEGVAVKAVDTEGPDGGVTVTVDDMDGVSHSVQARFVIDASGRDTFLANRRKTKTAHKELERTALGSHWRGADYAGGLQEGMIQIVYTGGEKQGWSWVIPVGSDRLSIGSVMNSSYYLQRRKEMKDAVGDDWQQALYIDEIMSAPFIKEILADAEQMLPVIYNGDYSCFCHEKWGDSFVQFGSPEETFGDHEHYESSMSLQHLLLAGDFFEKSGKYSDFVDTLNDQRKFKQYKKLVIQREKFQADRSCDVPSEVAFPEGLKEREKYWQEIGI